MKKLAHSCRRRGRSVVVLRMVRLLLDGGVSSILSSNEGKKVSSGGFKFSDEAHDAPAEVGVENDREDTDDEANRSGDEGFPDSFCKLELFEAFVFSRSELDEGLDHTDYGS